MGKAIAERTWTRCLLRSDTHAEVGLRKRRPVAFVDVNNLANGGAVSILVVGSDLGLRLLDQQCAKRFVLDAPGGAAARRTQDI